MSDILNNISGGDALTILKILVRGNAKLAQRVEQIAKENLSDIDPEIIAEDVYFQLNALEPEEVWDRSGKTRHGYIDPSEAADELFEETLEPYIEELNKYMNLSMDEQAMYYCLGILQGIRKFETEATTDYKDWATDSPEIHFDNVLELWRKKQTNPEFIDKMRKFIANGLNYEGDEDE